MFYELLEDRWTVTDTPSFESLVTPNGNSAEPLHSWFHLKEAFSHRLLHSVLKHIGAAEMDQLRLIDPTLGSGTTLISAADLVEDGHVSKVTAWGIETNPFLYLLASTKARARVSAVRGDVLSLSDLVAKAQAVLRVPDVPALSTFSVQEYWPDGNLEKLLRLNFVIGRMQDGLRRDIARVLLGACIEPASMLRRDGRALRYVSDKTPGEPYELFRAAVQRAAGDLPSVRSDTISVTLNASRGDARTMSCLSSDAKDVDLVLFSPPYPNNIDYTEVYKMESWLLGLIADSDGFRAQREKSMRSHPSIKFERGLTYVTTGLANEVANLIQPLLDAIPRDHRDQAGRSRMITGYVDDMLLLLQSAFVRIRPGGHLVYVVGNSRHGTGDDSMVIAADLLLARLCELVGFEVQEICVARRLRRRQAPGAGEGWLRESVVFVRRPPS